MESVRQYGFINAKIRAMKSEFLSDAAYRAMAALKEIRELFSYLSQTRYREMAENIEPKTPETLERALFWEEIRRLKIIEEFSKAGTKKILNLFLERYEAEKLKTILRCWHSSEKDAGYLIREPICYSYPVDSLLSSKNLDEFVKLLEGTPFQSTLKDRQPVYEEKKSLFPIEVALDQTVFERLWKASGSLSKTDRDILRRLVGIEIDLKNLDWVLRFRNYYKLPASEINSLLLTHGFRFGPEGIQRMLAEDRVHETLLDMSRSASIPLTGSEESPALDALELFLYQMLFSEAKKAFRGFPLSIGAVLGYVFLLRIESRNLRTLAHAKGYNMSAQETEPFLVY